MQVNYALPEQEASNHNAQTLNLSCKIIHQNERHSNIITSA